MASIITATTTSGLTQSADNSGVLQLASGTGNLVTVPSVTGTAMVSGNMPAFSAYLNSTQSFTSNTWTKVTLDVEEFDTNSNFASSRFTPTVAGYYQLNGTFAIGSSACNARCAIYKNGSAFKQGVYVLTNAAIVSVSSIVYLNGSTDYVELYGLFSTTQNAGTTETNFSGSMIRSA